MCDCGDNHPEGANYYVSVVDGPKVGLLAGPFADHQQALDLVKTVRVLAEKIDPWSHFYSLGTLAMKSEYQEPGRLNRLLSL